MDYADKEPIPEDNQHASSSSEKDVVVKVSTTMPYPSRVQPCLKSMSSEIYDVFKHVNVNIPLLDAIKQIPSYAKFLKDLCTVKRKMNVTKKVFLTEQVSSIIRNGMPLKFNDPGSPTIPCIIGTAKIEHALLDLGSSVNLLPTTLYEALGLGKLKDTSMILQLADRSMKMPKGIVEDVLVQVGNFYYPVDFVVLDMNISHVPNHSSIILGRPFLATSNALINCRNDMLKITFGNMALDLNIFSNAVEPKEIEDVHELCFVKSIVSDCVDVCPINMMHDLNVGNDFESSFLAFVDEYFMNDDNDEPLDSSDKEEKIVLEFTPDIDQPPPTFRSPEISWNSTIFHPLSNTCITTWKKLRKKTNASGCVTLPFFDKLTRIFVCFCILFCLFYFVCFSSFSDFKLLFTNPVFVMFSKFFSFQ